MADSLMRTYNRLPVTFTQGNGAWLTDEDGKQYLDALAGIAVCGLGHSHPAVTAAISEQAAQLIHTTNLYGIAAQQQLGDTLTRLSGMDRVFFGNSGAEANEAAIKLARLYGHKKGIDTPTVIVMEHSFHGRTMATLTATGNRKAQAGFEPLVKGFVRVPYNDVEAIKSAAATRNDIVAILVEPIQGEGGINIPANDYLNQLREICDTNEWLLMLDEIQTGMARTGKFFAFQHNDIQPDVMTLAKALGNGMPIGACLARGEAADLFAPGHHGSTFGGNPLACRAALATCEVLEQENFADIAAQTGQTLVDDFTQALGDIDGLVEIRGKGMMLAIELDRPCAELVKIALDNGLLINVTAECVVRLLPPLTLNQDEVSQLVDKLSEVIRTFISEG